MLVSGLGNGKQGKAIIERLIRTVHWGRGRPSSCIEVVSRRSLSCLRSARSTAYFRDPDGNLLEISNALWFSGASRNETAFSV